MKTIMADINMQDVDLYELLGISSTASVQEVKKAYRKKALTCHPDKNPDNPRAAELFHQLSKALEILIDDSARAAYDRVLNGKKAAKLRHRELDEKRKKLKEDLEAREKLDKLDTRTDEEKLQAEIDRLRKEGSQQVEEEVEFVRQQVMRESKTPSAEEHWSSGQNRLRIRWRAHKDDPNNGGYPYEKLLKIFSKYGDIVALVVSPKKNGSALIEFQTKDAVDTAVSLEKGFVNNPLTIERLNADGSRSSSQDPDLLRGAKLADLAKSEEESNCSIPSATLFPTANPSASTPAATTLPNFASAPDFSQLLYANYLTGQQLRYPGSVPASLGGAMAGSMHHSLPQLQAQMMYPMMVPGLAGYGQFPQYRAFAGAPLSYPTSGGYTGGFATMPSYASALQYMTAGAPLLAGSVPNAPQVSRASYATGVPMFSGQVAATFPSPAGVPSMATSAPMFFPQLLTGLPTVIPR